MHISEILKKSKTSLSYEFFPPKSEKASNNLYNAIEDLKSLNPAYVSVTYGAGGTTRERTHNLVVKIHKEMNIPVVSHLTCVGAHRDNIREILQQYNENDITNIMALRGDPPKGEDTFVPEKDGFNNATELVTFIKKEFPHFGIGVAGYPEGHPQTPNRLLEMDYLKAKVDAGADYICTQLFFDNHDFYDFVERCEISGIKIPIIAGVMPITSLKSMNRIAELSAGSHYPAKLLRHLGRCENDEQVRNAGLHWAAEQVRDLLDNNVPGIHFYTLNNSDHIKQICNSLGITDSAQLNK